VTRLCHNTDGGATGVRSGRRPQIPYLPLVKHTSKVLDVLRTLARDPERSKYRTAACRPDAKWSAAAGRPTSPHLNRDSSPSRFSAVSNGHFQNPLPLWKMRLEMVIGMQIEILNGIKKLPFSGSFQIFK